MVSPGSRRLSLRSALFYAAGDVGPSLTSLCLSFYWLYFLIEIAGIPVVQAGLIHSSGYVISAMANLWVGAWLDRRLHAAGARCRLIVVLGLALAICFATLWVVPPFGAARLAWYLLLSWLFHLLFSAVYLAYLSLTALIGSTERESVDLNSYRFGGTMLLTVLVLGLHSATEAIATMEQRLFALALLVSLLTAGGGALCGLGLRRTLGNAVAGGDVAGSTSVRWRTLGRSSVLWWAVGGNLAVWFMVQTALVLTIFLCAAAGVSDSLILMILQVSIIVAALFSSLAVRRWPAARIMAVAAALWCLGAAAWWQLAAPMAGALLLGLGLGAATVLSWARLPEALQRLAAAGDGRVDARAYAGLTVLRDLVSALVPLLAAFALSGRTSGSDVGTAAAGLLITAGLGAALVLLALRPLHGCRPAADGDTAPAPSRTG